MSYLHSAGTYVRTVFQTSADDRLKDSAAHPAAEAAVARPAPGPRNVTQALAASPAGEPAAQGAVPRSAVHLYAACAAIARAAVSGAERGGTLNMREGVNDWQSHHRGHLSIQPLPCDHAGVFFRPNIPHIADGITAWAATL